MKEVKTLESKAAQRAHKINELFEQGKAKGVLTYKQIMDALEELELDQEQVEKIYDRIE
jgi:RNA polymerase primary sigma factor